MNKMKHSEQCRLHDAPGAVSVVCKEVKNVEEDTDCANDTARLTMHNGTIFTVRDAPRAAVLRIYLGLEGDDQGQTPPKTD